MFVTPNLAYISDRSVSCFCKRIQFLVYPSFDAVGKQLGSHGNPRRLPVLIDSRLAYNAFDMVTILKCSAESL